MEGTNRSRAGSHFYGTEYGVWTDFGPVGNTDFFLLLLRVFFYVSWAKKHLKNLQRLHKKVA